MEQKPMTSHSETHGDRLDRDLAELDKKIPHTFNAHVANEMRAWERLLNSNKKD